LNILRLSKILILNLVLLQFVPPPHWKIWIFDILGVFSPSFHSSFISCVFQQWRNSVTSLWPTYMCPTFVGVNDSKVRTSFFHLWSQLPPTILWNNWLVIKIKYFNFLLIFQRGDKPQKCLKFCVILETTKI
jgi:hypothetical protein